MHKLSTCVYSDLHPRQRLSLLIFSLHFAEGNLSGKAAWRLSLLLHVNMFHVWGNTLWLCVYSHTLCMHMHDTPACLCGLRLWELYRQLVSPHPFPLTLLKTDCISPSSPPNTTTDTDRAKMSHSWSFAPRMLAKHENRHISNFVFGWIERKLYRVPQANFQQNILFHQ